MSRIGPERVCHLRRCHASGLWQLPRSKRWVLLAARELLCSRLELSWWLRKRRLHLLEARLGRLLLLKRLRYWRQRWLLLLLVRLLAIGSRRVAGKLRLQLRLLARIARVLLLQRLRTAIASLLRYELAGWLLLLLRLISCWLRRKGGKVLLTAGVLTAEEGVLLGIHGAHAEYETRYNAAKRSKDVPCANYRGQGWGA